MTEQQINTVTEVLEYGIIALFGLVCLIALMGTARCLVQKQFIGALNFGWVMVLSAFFSYSFYLDFFTDLRIFDFL